MNQNLPIEVTEQFSDLPARCFAILQWRFTELRATEALKPEWYFRCSTVGKPLAK